jgi:hypothetical protein
MNPISPSKCPGSQDQDHNEASLSQVEALQRHKNNECVRDAITCLHNCQAAITIDASSRRVPKNSACKQRTDRRWGWRRAVIVALGGALMATNSSTTLVCARNVVNTCTLGGREPEDGKTLRKTGSGRLSSFAECQVTENTGHGAPGWNRTWIWAEARGGLRQEQVRRC